MPHDTHDLPLPQPFYPTTFLERGAAVPFTTPLLVGSRARPGERVATELIVPNPSGGNGVYILPWNGVCELCHPTMHDARLNQRIAALRSVTPAAIRRCANLVAAEGLAGDEALKAARDITESDHGERLLTNFQLLMALINQVESSNRAGPSITSLRSHELEEYARRTVLRVAPRVGQTPEVIAEALEALADVLYGVGLHNQKIPSRLPRLLTMLRTMSDDVGRWGRQHSTEAISAYAEMVCTVAERTVSSATSTLQAAQTLSADMVDLLGQWLRDPQKIGRLAARPEWVLDGWERICLLWTTASDDAERRAALIEMGELVPVLPREISEWLGIQLESDRPTSFRVIVRLNEDWRTGAAVYNLIARNEHLRALAL